MSKWSYEPKDARRCLPEGEYEAVIADCDYGESKAGNDMATMKVEVTTESGGKVFVRDWLVNHAKMLWKLKDLAKAVGKLREFDEGSFEPHHAVGVPLIVVLSEEEDPKYGEQNRVAGYSERCDSVMKSGGRANATAGAYDIPEDSDAPF